MYGRCGNLLLRVHRFFQIQRVTAVLLADGAVPAKLMTVYNLSGSAEITDDIKRIGNNFFAEDSD